MKNNCGLKTDPIGVMKSLTERPCIRLKMSSKYPIEGSEAYAQLLEKINHKLLKSNNYKILPCDKENDENQSNCGGMEELGVEEITILNPTWVFDSISDYFIMSTV